MPITKIVQAGYNNNVFFKNVPYWNFFKPTQIQNCQLWLDGSDPAGNGVVPAAGNLATWVDKSTSANNAIAGTSVYPQYTTAFLNGLGVVGLTNSADYFTVANNFNSSSLTYVFLMKPTAANTGSYCGILSTDTASQFGRSIAVNNMVFQVEYYSGFQATSITTNSSTWYIVSVVFDGTSSIKLSYNGTISTYAGSGTGTNTSGLTIGSYNNTSSYTTYNANFYLAEAVVYTRALSQTEFQQVESYLAQKWGLSTSLAANHLNATFPAGSPEIVKNYIPQVQTSVTNILFFISIMSTVYTLSTYSLAAIANSVSAASGTVSYIWTVAVPSGAKGKNAILVIFFNLYSLTQFQANQYFDYGIYVDGVIQGFGDTGTARYIHTAAGNYALNNGGITYGTNAMSPYQPLIIPLVLASGATTIQLGIKNSQSALTPLASTQIGYLTNNTSSTGTINTSGYSPQTLFTTAGSNFYTVPTTCSAGTVTGVFVYLWGSGGQGTNNGATRYCVGGAGGFVSGYYACAGGTNLIYVVGSPAGTGAAATGGGGVGGGNTGGQGYDGGGFTGLFLSNAGGIAQSNAIAIAGGGGGGGLGGNCVGGYGGYPTGGAPTQYGTGTVATAILGGSQTAGGIGDRNTGSALLGASSSGASDGGGAGGGGWYGGGSHGSGQWVSGTGGYFGGAGGSSYVGSTLGATPSPAGIGLTSSAVTSNGNTSATYTPSVPGGVSSTYYPASGTYGYGDVTSLRTGGGCIAIVPAVGANPVNVGVSAKLYSV